MVCTRWKCRDWCSHMHLCLSQIITIHLNNYYSSKCVVNSTYGKVPWCGKLVKYLFSTTIVVIGGMWWTLYVVSQCIQCHVMTNLLNSFVVNISLCFNQFEMFQFSLTLVIILPCIFYSGKRNGTSNLLCNYCSQIYNSLPTWYATIVVAQTTESMS
jgi:hypothetical protein